MSSRVTGSNIFTTSALLSVFTSGSWMAYRSGCEFLFTCSLLTSWTCVMSSLQQTCYLCSGKNIYYASMFLEWTYNTHHIRGCVAFAQVEKTLGEGLRPFFPLKSEQQGIATHDTLLEMPYMDWTCILHKIFFRFQNVSSHISLRMKEENLDNRFEALQSILFHNTAFLFGNGENGKLQNGAQRKPTPLKAKASWLNPCLWPTLALLS